MNAALDKILNYQSLAATLMFANTPIYLYTNFRRDNSIMHLARKYETSSLLDDLDELLSHPIKDLNGAVQVYAICICLSFKPANELTRLKSLSKTDLEWFEKIKSLVLEDAPSSKSITINLSRKPNVVLLDRASKSGALNSNQKTTVVFHNSKL